MKILKEAAIIIFIVIILLLFSISIMNKELYATTTLPKVYLTVDNEEAFRDLTKEDGEKTATLRYEDSSNVQFSSNIKIKIQGSTSAKYPKKNYTIKLYEDSAYSEKQKVDMGWGKFNKYCLKANWIDDKTHSRNIVTAKLTAKVQEKYGLFTDTPNNGVIDGFPVEMYLNGEFLGLYTWNIPKDAWMWNLDDDNPNNIAMEASMVTDETLFKEKIASVDALGDDEKDPDCSGWEIETGPETQETVDKFNRLINFVKNSTDEEFIENFDSYINKDAMLNYLAIQYMAEATDNVSKNMIWVTYDGQIWYPILYDLDTTYGMHHRGQKLHDSYFWLPENDEVMESASSANKSLILKKVIRCFPDEFAERWFELRKDILSDEGILTEFNNFIGIIPESIYELEKTTWEKITGEPIRGYDFDQIKEFLMVRLPYIDEVMYNKYTEDMPARLNITYSTSNITNGTVTATAVAERNDITFGSNPTTYTFSENGKYIFTATDGLGKTVTATATVNWIDKTAPAIEISYNEKNLTNQDVVVTIMANEEIQAVAGWNLSTDKKSISKTYTENGSETIAVYDIAGNKSIDVQVSVNNIDKVAPTITGVEDGKKYESSVTPIIKDENLNVIKLTKDGIIIENYQSGTEITESGKYVLTANDKAGNTTTVSFEIEKQEIIIPPSGVITSDEYTVMEGDRIKDINPGTTVEQFKEKINAEIDYVVLDKDNNIISETSKIGTGCIVKLANDRVYTLIVSGDCNGDGNIKLSDMTIINRYRLKKITLEKDYLLAADVTEDGEVDFKDLVKINRFRLSKIKEL